MQLIKLPNTEVSGLTWKDASCTPAFFFFSHFPASTEDGEKYDKKLMY